MILCLLDLSGAPAVIREHVVVRHGHVLLTQLKWRVQSSWGLIVPATAQMRSQPNFGCVIDWLHRILNMHMWVDHSRHWLRNRLLRGHTTTSMTSPTPIWSFAGLLQVEDLLLQFIGLFISSILSTSILGRPGSTCLKFPHSYLRLGLLLIVLYLIIGWRDIIIRGKGTCLSLLREPNPNLVHV